MSDDLLFGIGYSSLGIVQRLPIDILKLDRSFVETGSGGGGLQRDLLKALVRVITTHGISVICEGVETKEQEEFLREIQCDYAQGYRYAVYAPDSCDHPFHIRLCQLALHTCLQNVP